MDTKETFSQLLGLTPEWKVSDVDLDMNCQRIEINVEWVGGQHGALSGVWAELAGVRLSGYAPLASFGHDAVRDGGVLPYASVQVPRARCGDSEDAVGRQAQPVYADV